MLNWLFVDMNAYFASVEQQVNPELRGKPVMVCPSLVDTTCAIAASYEAKKFGIKTGTMVREAKKICPGVIAVEAHPSMYVEYHNKIVDAVESCLPVTAVMSVDEMACRLRGSDQALKNAMKLGLEIKAAIRKRAGDYLTCSVGIAPNRFLAKVASDMQKPDGLTVIEQFQIPEKLMVLKPSDFPGIGNRMEHRLHMRGIKTMRDLYDLSKAEMKSVWGGIIGLRMYEWMRGVDLELEESPDQKSVGHSHVLPPDLRTMDLAYATAQKLTHKAAHRMRKLGFWARGFSLYVRFMHQHGWSANVRVLECQDTFTILEALKTLWSEVPDGKPFAVGVTLYDFVSDQEHTFGLFHEQKRMALSQALDEINVKYGSNSVYYGGIHHVRTAAPTRISFTQIPEFDF